MTEDLLTELGIKVHNVWLQSTIDIVAVFVLYFLAVLILGYFKKRFIARLPQTKHYEAANRVFFAVYDLIKKILLLIALVWIIDALPIAHKYDAFIDGIIYGIGVFLAAAALFELTDVTTAYFFTNRERDVSTLVSRVAKILLVMIGTMIVLRHFNYDIWHIVTALGIGSLAIGLAAQPTLTSIIAGFNLLIDRPFQRIDRVKLASGEIGDVVYIGLRSTQIRTVDGNMLIVPNSELVNSRVINFSLPNHSISNTLKFQFELASSPDQIKTVLLAAIAPIENMMQPPIILLNGIVGGAIEMTVEYKTERFDLVNDVRDKIIQAALNSFNGNKISIAGPRLKTTLDS